MARTQDVGNSRGEDWDEVLKYFLESHGVTGVYATNRDWLCTEIMLLWVSTSRGWLCRTSFPFNNRSIDTFYLFLMYKGRFVILVHWQLISYDNANLYMHGCAVTTLLTVTRRFSCYILHNKMFQLRFDWSFLPFFHIFIPYNEYKCRTSIVRKYKTKVTRRL